MTIRAASIAAVPRPDDSSALPAQRTQRLLSLDALRGFDMFWIIGGEEIFHALNRATVGKPLHAPFAFAAWQLTHKDWEGFGFYDLIFPMFVFMVGSSLVFSLRKRMATAGRAAAVRHVILRAAILFALGLIYYWTGRTRDLYELRVMGVLQRIALAYLFAGLLFCFLRSRAMVAVLVSLLVVYWALLTFVPAPGEPHVSFAEGHNLTNWLDAHFLPGYKWDDLPHDPEGILSTIPAVASCLLGVLAGLLLRDSNAESRRKVLYLVAGGVACVLLGFLWGRQFPVIKKLWTSSFVLVAGGYSAILLGIFYLLIDVWKLRGWAMPFVWIGMNAIALYLAEHFLDFAGLADKFVGGKFGQQVLGAWQPVWASLLAMTFMMLLAWFLYSRKIFLKV